MTGAAPDPPESRLRLSRYAFVDRALRHHGLRQALYDEGAVVMEGVLLTLHGDAHRRRRRLENRLFRRDVFRHYEKVVVPRNLEQALAPALASGRAELMELVYRITMNFTATFAGIDRPEGSVEETEALLSLVRKFSEGATMVHSTRDKEVLRGEVRAALDLLSERFLTASIARRQEILARWRAGELDEATLPSDVLTVLLRHADELAWSDAELRREMAFFLQAGSHSTVNSVAHALHEIFLWCEAHPGDRARLEADAWRLQRFVHESMRLHPASPVAWRRPVETIARGELVPGEPGSIGPETLVELDMAAANREAELFGEDAERFDPGRKVREGVPPFGLSFGSGTHACLGRDLAAGAVVSARAREEARDPEHHLFGAVCLIVSRLLRCGAERDPDDPPERDPNSQRDNFRRYPLRLLRPVPAEPPEIAP